MTKCQAICAVDDACQDKDHDALNLAIQDALKVGCAPWNIKATLRENYIPVSHLWLETQDALK